MSSTFRFAAGFSSALLGFACICGCESKPPAQPVAKQPAGRSEKAPEVAKQPEKSVDNPPETSAPNKAESPVTPAPESSSQVVIPKSQNLVAGNAAPQVPAVFMSEGHTKSLKVGVGQTFPQLPLTDSAGKPVDLKSQLGKFTVVVFWSAKEPVALEELQDLQYRVLDPYKNVGMRVVAINPVDGDKPETTAWLQKAGLTFPTLNDAGGKLFDAVGRGPLPRTFLIDDAGKILWLDIEYSRTTRRHLVENALPAVLKEI